MSFPSTTHFAKIARKFVLILRLSGVLKTLSTVLSSVSDALSSLSTSFVLLMSINWDKNSTICMIMILSLGRLKPVQNRMN